MAQEVKYLSYSGLSHLKDILEGRYEKKGHTHSYLPLAGGTITGLLTIKCSPSAIQFNNSAGTKLGYLGINADDDPVAYKADGTTMRHILHSGNYANYALPISGGALTGPLVFNGSDADRNVIRVNCTSGDASQIGNYSYTLKFLGSGTGVNNALALYADNQTATTQNLATKWLNDGTMYGRSILPHTTNTFDLGSSSLKWKNIYATTFTGNLTGNVTGHLNGTISIQAGNANAYRNILVTNGSNGIWYSSAGNVQLNYSTGDVKATSFTGNLNGNASSANFANTLKLSTATSNVARPVIFQDGNLSTDTLTACYDNDFKYNPSSNTLTVAHITGNAATANSATRLRYGITLPSCSSTNTNKWIKFAQVNVSLGAYVNCSGYLIFNNEEVGGFYGIMGMHIRTSSTIATTSIQLRWIALSNQKYSETVAAVKVNDGVWDLYFKPVDNYTNARIYYHGLQANRITFESGEWVDTIEANTISTNQGAASDSEYLRNGGKITTTSDLDSLPTSDKLKYNLYSNPDDTSIGLSNGDGFVLTNSWTDTKYAAQLALDDSGYNVSFRYKNNTWQPWKKLAFVSDIPLTTTATEVTHTHYGTNGSNVPTMNFLSYWNGAYNSSNSSNLTYCKKGAFGTIVTKNTGDYLPISGGTLTGDLSFNPGNVDRFINFNYNNGTTYSWRLGYLGSGSGDANYFTIQSAKAAGTQWYPVVNFGNETLNANFAGDILPMTSNTKNLGSSSLKWANVYATTLYENGTSLTNKYATKHTHTELSDDEIDAILINLGVTL